MDTISNSAPGRNPAPHISPPGPRNRSIGERLCPLTAHPEVDPKQVTLVWFRAMPELWQANVLSVALEMLLPRQRRFIESMICYIARHGSLDGYQTRWPS